MTTEPQNTTESQAPAIDLWTRLKNYDYWQKLKRPANILAATTEKFLKDECLWRANSIAFAIVFSIIPLLAVLVNNAIVDQDIIRESLTRFMASYGMSDATEVLVILQNIINRANAIGAVGSVFIAFSATNLIYYLEDAFSYIYRAATSRPIHYRFAIYLSSLILLPAIAILGGRTFRIITTQIKPPELTHSLHVDDRIWITAGKEELRVQEGQGNKKTRIINLRDLTETDSKNNNFYINIRKPPGTEVKHEFNQGSHLQDIQFEDFGALKKTAIFKDNVYVISESGVLFYSRNGGTSWDYSQFRFLNTENEAPSDNRSRRPFLEDILLDETGQVYLLATLDARSTLLTQKTPGVWVIRATFENIYHHIMRYDTRQTTKALAGLYLAGNGHFLFSQNRGVSWVKKDAHLKNERNLQLNVIIPDLTGHIHFAGLEAAFLKQGPVHNFISSIRARGTGREVYGAHLTPEGPGLLYGEDALIRFTPDGGKTWLRIKNKKLNSITFYSHSVLPGGELILVGENQTIVRAKPPRLSAHRDSKGRLLAEMQISGIENYPVLLSLIRQFFLAGLFFALFLMLFVLAYKFLPNSPVGWTPAFIGGAITATALVVFVLLFRYWVVSFSTTGFIYGVWAVIPVGMLVILTFTQIILFGLELAYVIQHPYLYQHKSNQKKDEDPEEYLFWNAVLLISLIHQRMYIDNRPLTMETALPYFNNDVRALTFTREQLLGKNLFAYDSAGEEFFPVRPPNELTLATIQKEVLGKTLETPTQTTLSNFRSKFSELQKEMALRLEKGAGKATIADMLPLLPKRGKK